MKRKFSKILGVGLTLALLISLLLTAAPVSADVTQPTVAVDPATISAVDAEYTIRFRLGEQLTGGSSVTASTGNYNLAEIGDSFVITATTAGDTATITEGASGDETVTVTLSGGATLTSYAPPVHTVAFNAIGATATVTVLTVDTTTGLNSGAWAITGGAPGALVGVGAAADTITIVFESDTTVDTGPTAAMVAGPGWINGLWKDATIGTLPAPAGTVDTRTVVITLAAATSVGGTDGARIGEGAEVRLTLTAGIDNPSTPAAYNLTVETSKEDTAVPSADYTIAVPTIPGLPGVANVYNPVGVLMAQEISVAAAVAAAGDNYTIEVGPGTYAGVGIPALDLEGLTLVSTDGAATTIIEGPITIDAPDVIVDGFTFDIDSGSAITVTSAGTDAIVQNNVITAEDGWPMGIDLLNATDATVSDNELSINTTMMVRGATDCTLSDNTFGAGINVQGSTGITITGNDIIGSEYTGIVFESTASADILIEGNTISGTVDAEGTGIYFRDGIGGTEIQIIGNDITDNEGEAIGITSVALTDSVIKFNTITGNNTETGDHAIQNDSGADVDATFNWWGTDVAADIADMVSGDDVIYEPFLTGTAEAVVSASDVAAGAESLDAKDTVGVRVSVAAATPPATDVISVAKYIANPQAAISDAIAFYDVYVAGTFVADDEATIKFYAGDANTKVFIWSADTETWGEVTPVAFSAYGGYVYVTVDVNMLGGTPFALVAGAAAAITAPEITVPVSGDDTVSLTPVFAWDAVAAADGYYFELADNANFVAPLVKLDGDFGRLITTAYAYVTELPYSTAYYWRVKAVSGTEAAGTLKESAWTSAVFVTMDEPEEPTPPVVIEEAPELPDITIEQPDITIEIPEIVVPLPDVVETPITPTWIYVIIGVGAVLVIALLVLIVRTRRVA